MGRTIAGLAVALAALGFAAPAAAVTIPNACHWNASNTWEQESLTFSGSATPDRAGAGSAVTLSGLSARFVIAEEVIKEGYLASILKAGDNDVAFRAWIAVRGANTAEGVQVREASGTARTTITTDANQEFVSATPLDVQSALGDTQWTIGSAFPTTFTQAEAGTLPPLPAGQNGGSVTPKGSALIVATLGTLRVQIDCQPGTRAPDRSGPVPAAGTPFAAVFTPDTPPGAVIPAAPRPPVLTLRSSKLRDSKGRIAVKLSCAAAPCSGTIAIKTASKVKVGKRRQVVTVTRARTYSLAAGESRTLTLKTSAAARALLAERNLAVRVTTRPKAGEPLTRKLTLVGSRNRTP